MFKGIVKLHIQCPKSEEIERKNTSVNRILKGNLQCLKMNVRRTLKVLYRIYLDILLKDNSTCVKENC